VNLLLLLIFLQASVKPFPVIVTHKGETCRVSQDNMRATFNINHPERPILMNESLGEATEEFKARLNTETAAHWRGNSGWRPGRTVYQLEPAAAAAHKARAEKALAASNVDKAKHAQPREVRK
jgi:hypothetical protein